MSAESTGTPGPERFRASDAEREEYARIVRDAVGEGRLGLDEGDERLAAIYAAKFRDELPSSISDLPREEETRGYGRDGAQAHRGSRSAGPRSSGPRPPGADPSGPHPFGPRGDFWYARARRGFARHLGFVAVVAAILTGIWVLTGAHFFWPAIPLAFLALGLFRRACWAGWSRREWYERQRSGQA